MITNHNNSDVKPYLVGQAFITCIEDESQLDILYLDSYTLKHIYNSQNKFVNLWAKTYKLVIARGDIIWSNQVRTIIVLLKNSSELTLSNVIYILGCKSNLIYLE